MRVKFKFKFIPMSVKKRYLYIFPSSKMMFNFKFKLILREEKIYVNNFFINFWFSRFSQFNRLSQLSQSTKENPPLSPPFNKGGFEGSLRTAFPLPWREGIKGRGISPPP
jgi:hypothetical protein